MKYEDVDCRFSSFFFCSFWFFFAWCLAFQEKRRFRFHPNKPMQVPPHYIVLPPSTMPLGSCWKRWFGSKIYATRGKDARLHEFGVVPLRQKTPCNSSISLQRADSFLGCSADALWLMVLEFYSDFIPFIMQIHPKDLDYKVPCLLPIMEVEAETMMKGVLEGAWLS